MNKLLRKSVLWFILWLIFTAIIGGGVLAAVYYYTVSIPSHVKVIAPSPNYTLGVYSDPNCTIPLSNIEWGAMEQGGSSTQSAWVKNLGNQTIKIDLTSDIPVGTGTVEKQASSWEQSLIPNQSREYKVKLKLLDAATPGDTNFTINFHSTE